MFSLFKRKGKTRKQQRENDFAHSKGAIKQGEKLTARDKQMQAVGRVHVHLNNTNDYNYKLSKLDKRAIEHDLKHLKGDLSYIEQHGTDMSGKKKSKSDIDYLKYKISETEKTLKAKNKSISKSKTKKTKDDYHSRLSSHGAYVDPYSGEIEDGGAWDYPLHVPISPFDKD